MNIEMSANKNDNFAVILIRKTNIQLQSITNQLCFLSFLLQCWKIKTKKSKKTAKAHVL